MWACTLENVLLRVRVCVRVCACGMRTHVQGLPRPQEEAGRDANEDGPAEARARVALPLLHALPRSHDGDGDGVCALRHLTGPQLRRIRRRLSAPRLAAPVICTVICAVIRTVICTVICTVIRTVICAVSDATRPHGRGRRCLRGSARSLARPSRRGVRSDVCCTWRRHW